MPRQSSTTSSRASSSSTPLLMADSDYIDSTRQSSVATSPPPSGYNSPRQKSEELQNDDADITIKEKEPSEAAKYLEELDADERYDRLKALLEKSTKYAYIIHQQMSLVKHESKATRASKKSAASRGGKRKRGSAAAQAAKKRRTIVSDEEEETSPPEQTVESNPNQQEERFEQPALVTGGTLKSYQLEGVAWMVSLWNNGISGILADEMGLGKTLQTISFSAYLRERSSQAFLIVGPLSVLHNWVDEYKKFAPKIPVVMYHGTPENRAVLRKTVMKTIMSSQYDLDDAMMAKMQQEGEDGVIKKPPVVITTYEMIIKDAKYLSKCKWGHIIVDEGHRLKNMDCKLMQEIKRYRSGSRLILTGTPLHNNLTELWSLLNFILPDIFQDLNTFQEWFNIPTMHDQLTSEQTTNVVSMLHSILKPFLLRRLKSDVEFSLPPKKEYVLYAPLTEQQKSVYEAVVNGSLRRFLINGKQKQVDGEKTKEQKAEEREKMLKEGRKLRQRDTKIDYNVDGSDSEYFKKLESGEIEAENIYQPKALSSALASGRAYQLKTAVKQVNNLHLQNAVMQLRKVCSHPFLFDWPIDPETHEEVVNDELVGASGKMLVLDRLLTELFKRGHKVLLFSQFTTMLNIIEAWATEFKGWNLCRIDGSSGPMERREEMARFQNGGDDPDTPRLFILSTRAGGLGINLTAADTVIFYDQDWNPQMDMQAQDRAHRIGQTKPVLIFRLVTAHTIENTIMQRANEKRRLEALVIAKGKFKVAGSLITKNGKEKDSLADIAVELLKLEGEKIEVVQNTKAGKSNVISDKDLDILLDRSPEVFADRHKGWTSADTKSTVEDQAKTKTAFAVFESNEDEGNDALANMLGEELD